MLLPVTSCRNTTSAPTARTASRNSGRMNLRLKKVKPLRMLTVSTLKENAVAVLSAASAVCVSPATSAMAAAAAAVATDKSAGARLREEPGNKRFISRDEQAREKPGCLLLIFGQLAAVGRQLICGESADLHEKYKLDTVLRRSQVLSGGRSENSNEKCL